LKIAVDIDGVLADQVGAVLKVIEEEMLEAAAIGGLVRLGSGFESASKIL